MMTKGKYFFVSKNEKGFPMDFPQKDENPRTNISQTLNAYFAKEKAKGDARFNAELEAAQNHLQYTLAQRPRVTEACRIRHRLSSIAAQLGFEILIFLIFARHSGIKPHKKPSEIPEWLRGLVTIPPTR